MEKQYEEVPSMISCKDLDYLSDIFRWNYGAYKNTSNAINSVEDSDIKVLLNSAKDVFYNTMTKVLEILSNGGNDE